MKREERQRRLSLVNTNLYQALSFLNNARFFLSFNKRLTERVTDVRYRICLILEKTNGKRK